MARYPSLDGLRGIAVLLVVMHNLLLIRDPLDGPSHVLVALLDRGWIGVQLFFVLSGFLITGLLLDSDRTAQGLKNFIVRRALRILPLYYALLAALTLLLPMLHLLPATFHRAPQLEVYLWTYLWNWVGPFHPHEASFPHLWSLAVEEQFYLLWPLLVLGRPPRKVLIWCGIFAVASLAGRVLLLAWGEPTEAVYQFTICRMDALALGGAVAAVLRMPEWRERTLALRRRWAGAALGSFALGALCSGFYRVFTPAGQSIGYSALAVAFAFWVLWAACADLGGDTSRFLGHPVLAKVGLYSYGMYLLHVPLHQLIGEPLLALAGIARPPGAALALAYVLAGTALSYAAARLSYHAFEMHFLRLKERFAPRRDPAEAQAATLEERAIAPR